MIFASFFYTRRDRLNSARPPGVPIEQRKAHGLKCVSFFSTAELTKEGSTRNLFSSALRHHNRCHGVRGNESLNNNHDG